MSEKNTDKDIEKGNVKDNNGNTNKDEIETKEITSEKNTVKNMGKGHMKDNNENTNKDEIKNKEITSNDAKNTQYENTDTSNRTIPMAGNEATIQIDVNVIKCTDSVKNNELTTGSIKNYELTTENAKHDRIATCSIKDDGVARGSNVIETQKIKVEVSTKRVVLNAQEKIDRNEHQSDSTADLDTVNLSKYTIRTVFESDSSAIEYNPSYFTPSAITPNIDEDPKDIDDRSDPEYLAKKAPEIISIDVTQAGKDNPEEVKIDIGSTEKRKDEKNVYFLLGNLNQTKQINYLLTETPRISSELFSKLVRPKHGRGREQKHNRSDIIASSTGDPLLYEPATRNYFVLLVFAVLLIMFFSVGCIIFIYTLIPELNLIVGHFLPVTIIIASLGLVVTQCCMIYVPFCRRFPLSFFMATLMVIFGATLAIVIMHHSSIHVVMLALAVTMSLCMLCMLLACSVFDFTNVMTYVVALAIVSILLGLGILTLKNIYKMELEPLTILVLFVYIILNTIFIVVVLQMILGGRTVEISDDEYVFGACMLFASILMMFLNCIPLLEVTDDS